MGRWGRCDYRELKKLDERLQQLSEVDMDRLCRDAAKKVAQILLNKVKKRTPVGVVPSYANVPLLIAAFKTFVTLLIAVFGDFSSIFAAIRKSFHVHAGYPNI